MVTSELERTSRDTKRLAFSFFASMTFLFLFILCVNILLLAVIYFSRPRVRGWLFVSLGIFFPFVSFALYANLGHFWLTDSPLQRATPRQAELAGQGLAQKNTPNDIDSNAMSSEAQQAFAALSPAERELRIRTMVASLSQRLQTSGGEPQEWLRLARAQSVLGDKVATRAALEQAEKLHPSLVREKFWLASSIAILLASQLDELDKKRIKRQLEQAKTTASIDAKEIEILEQRLAPLLK